MHAFELVTVLPCNSFCFLSGGVLFNVVGVILAIPVALTIKTVLATLYEEPVDNESGAPDSLSSQAKPA